MDFVKDIEGLQWELRRKKFAEQLSIFGNTANSDSKRKKIGSAEIYEGGVIPTTQSFNRVPGSRGSNQPKGKGKAKGTVGYRYNRGLTGQKLETVILAKRIISYLDKKKGKKLPNPTKI